MVSKRRKPSDPTATHQWDDLPEMENSLLIASPRGTTWRPLPRGSWLDIGRSVEAFISLDDDGVSRNHARIRCSDKVLVEELGSKNGTTLDGRPLLPGVSQEWRRGSCLVLGATTIMLQAGGDAQLVPARVSEHAISDPRARWEAMVDRISEQCVPVLILGETGTGKEVTAERIHMSSPRRHGPLIKVHAAALSQHLLEAELFGHERGAFTGADRTRVGLIEQAHRGTLFIDEVAEIPLEKQVKLLRVLEDRRVRRVGGDQERSVDFRLIAATNRDIESEVSAGAFRADLYFRLATFTLRLSPLRERRDEIPDLTRTFLAEWATHAGDAPKALDPAAFQELQSYDWPGNIRELRAVLHRATVVANGPLIQRHDLPLEDMRRRSVAGEPASAAAPAEELAPERDDERARVVAALAQCAGNQSQAARLLGVSRRTLVNRLAEFDLPRPRKR